MIGEREQNILEILVREYIKTAEPVSSEKIARRMKNTLSSASIRNIFSDLTEKGYIEQPHTSGGRVPLTSGYRFFVNRILADGDRSSLLPHEVERLLFAHDSEESLRTLQNKIAEHFHLLSYWTRTRPIGFDEMFHEPEFFDQSYVQEFGTFLDTFERFEEKYSDKIDADSFDIVIGEENQTQSLHHISIVITKTSEGDMFCIAGPMRMRYDCIIDLMRLWKKKDPKKR